MVLIIFYTNSNKIDEIEYEITYFFQKLIFNNELIRDLLML